MADIDIQRINSSKLLKTKISQLTRLAEINQSILDEDLTDEMGNLLRTSGKYALTSEIISNITQYALFQMFEGDTHVDRMSEFASNIDKAAGLGVYGIGAGMDMDRLSAEGLAVYRDLITQDAMSYVTGMQEDLKQALADKFADALEKDLMPNDISNMIRDEFGVSQARANSIARTETMRANNQIQYEQAKANGAQFFVIDNREESCEECQAEYEGQVFGIDEDDAMPPLHPNCACVPTFFNNEKEAQDWIDGIQFDNMERREELAAQDMYPASDGTGSVKLSPERLDMLNRMEDTPLMTIPRPDLYKQNKLMYKKIRNPILNARQDLQRPKRGNFVKSIKNGTAQPFNTKKTKIPVNERRVYELHIHSDASPDSTEKIANIVREAKRIGLDGIALTNHNNLSAALKAAEKYSTKNFKVIPGVEITSSKGHIIALGIKTDIRSGMSPERTIRAIKKQGGVAILPHSFARYRDGVLYKTGNYANKIADMVHGLETVNARYSTGSSNFNARAFAELKGIPQIAGSDGHKANSIGMALTEIRSKNNSVSEILNSIRNGRTNVYDSQVPFKKLGLTKISYPTNKLIDGKTNIPIGDIILQQKTYNPAAKYADDFRLVKTYARWDSHYKQYTAILTFRSETLGSSVTTTVPLGTVKRSASEWNRLIKQKFDSKTFNRGL
jgi:hypothetical protein